MKEMKDIVRRSSSPPTREAEGEFRIPPVDIHETEDSIVLLADMPGVSEKGVEVSLEEDMLCISGRVDTPAQENASVLVREFEPLPFRRMFRLSADVSRDGIEGKIQNGVLRLVLPKAEQAKVRKIPVKSA